MPHFNYKTKPCYSYEKTGHCQKGQQCQYAHGLQELRQHQHQQHQQQLEKHGGEWNKGAWLPPGADRGNQVLFGHSFDPSFYIPPRLSDKSADLVNAVNDFHFAMVNDFERNEFYRKCLEKVITPNSRVLEIGTGSGLLAMIAARLGAEWVLAVEANKDMAELARQNIAKNNLSERIRVLNMLSTELELRDMPNKANVLVSELFGTLLLGESALNYLHDARQRLLEPNSHIVPPKGIQYVTPIECKDLESITSVSSWGGLDLRHLNTLQDTVSVVFTKQYGFRFSTVPMTIMADKIPILEVDFSKHGPDDMPRHRTFPIRCKSAGTIHCLMLTWEVFDNEGTEVMSTDPSRTTFARDMQWGQALQLLEDVETGDGTYPIPFRVEEGELLTLGVKYSCDGVVVQFDVRRNR